MQQDTRLPPPLPPQSHFFCKSNHRVGAPLIESDFKGPIHAQEHIPKVRLWAFRQGNVSHPVQQWHNDKDMRESKLALISYGRLLLPAATAAATALAALVPAASFCSNDCEELMLCMSNLFSPCKNVLGSR